MLPDAGAAQRQAERGLLSCAGKVIILFFTAVALLVIGFEVTLVLWPAGRERTPGPVERMTMAATIAAVLWIGSAWVLALTKQLTFAALAGRAVVVTLVALMLIVRRNRIDLLRSSRVAPVALIAALPILLWIVFVMWRGAIVPPLSHDALSYHLPRAVLFERAHGFRYLVELDPRQRNIPANYELMLTEMLVVQDSDKFTEWPSAVFYILFVAACGAVAERWWGRGRHVGVVMMFISGLPVLLLHSGAHKNDLMTAFFMVAAVVLFGRWLSEGEPAALLLLMAAMAAAVGTKPQAAGLAFFMTPFVLHRLVRELRGKMSWRWLPGIAFFAISAFLLLGGFVFVSNVLHERALVGRMENHGLIMYGDWANLWQAPYVLLAAPFAPKANALRVPWEEMPWFWQRYEIYFSHLGIPFSICAVLAPVAVFLLRRRERPCERGAVTIACVATFVLMLPVIFKPHGMYAISLPRYALFIVPVVFGWTIAPLAMNSRRAAIALTVAGVACFCFYAVDNAVNDAFAPLDYVLWAREHPGTREIPFENGRAASVVDRLAGPHDKIAFDAGYASWIYPAFGARLTRPVYFIPSGTGPVAIPDDAKWVVIDRAWGIFWGAGEELDLSDARRFLMRGQPTPDELRVRRQLLRDQRFHIAYLQRGTNQVVFERVR